jgi:hypothetical protein
MAFADLTPEQQGAVAEYVRQMRAMVGEFARLLNRFEALDNMYDGQAAAILALAESVGAATKQEPPVETVSVEAEDGTVY